jgi:hypothetical protein
MSIQYHASVQLPKGARDILALDESLETACILNKKQEEPTRIQTKRKYLFLAQDKKSYGAVSFSGESLTSEEPVFEVIMINAIYKALSPGGFAVLKASELEKVPDRNRIRDCLAARFEAVETIDMFDPTSQQAHYIIARKQPR